jgi:CubicO group peptidase (beta-lactamase class C family)
MFALDAAPGMAVVVVRDTQVIYLKGFGYADLEARRAFTPQTVFYIASTTKSFTGLAASILDQSGTSSSTRRSASICRAFGSARPSARSRSRFAHCCRHTHGISNAGPLSYRTRLHGRIPRRRASRRVARAPRSGAETVARNEYGNIGYNVAALAMDAATKEMLEGNAATTALRSRCA